MQRAASGGTDPLAHARSRPPVAEHEAIARVLELARVTGVRLHVASRHGMLPLPHASAPFAPAVPPELPAGPLTLAEARRFVFVHVRANGDWRSAIDGLRPVTDQLWAQLDGSARRGFVLSTTTDVPDASAASTSRLSSMRPWVVSNR